LKLSETLGLPMSKVRVIATYVGGGFGGKHFQAQPETVALAMKTDGVPVKVQFTREESFQGTSLRHPSIVTIQTGVKKDGTLVARKNTVIMDTGAFSERGVMVTKNAGYSSPGPYRIPHVWIDAYCVYTNKTTSGAFRGFGIPQVCWAHEVHTEELAGRLGMDSYEFRMKNAFVDGDLTWTGQKLVSVSVKECLEAAYQAIEWPRRRENNGNIRRGRGIAAMHKSTVAFAAGATLKINEDGTVNVLSSAVDCGQGSNTMLGQIVAEELGVKPESVVMHTADTDIGPFDWGTAASRVTFILGPAVRRAAIDARNQLLERAADQMEARPDDLFIRDGAIRFKSDPEKGMPLSGVLMGNHRQGGKGTPIIGVGTHTSEMTPLDEMGHGERPTPLWMHAAQAAEVEVDVETGEVRVTRLVGAHDVGKAINPVGCVAQIEGALATGLGYALSEELRYDGGECINGTLADYKIPTTLDCPPYVSRIIEVPHEEGPYGAKGLGEPGLAPTAAAIANAIHDACGVRIRDLPMTAEKVYAALQKLREEGKL
ncbi:MAG: molybdopterin-dependent oxidoreductase, partial [Candidatus Tectomicrobia bacterium]|nr:molybdopterin-dependent oxidoreductase [Candidatus Tectomicrobia bacterium]